MVIRGLARLLRWLDGGQDRERVGSNVLRRLVKIEEVGDAARIVGEAVTWR